MTVRLEVSFADAAELIAVYEAELFRGGLLVRGAVLEKPTPQAECVVVLKAGAVTLELAGKIAAVVPGVGVAVMFAGVPPELKALVDRVKAGEPLEGPAEAEPTTLPPEEESPVVSGTVADRLKALTVPQKMSQALSGDREVRFALLRDQNKTLHVFVLKNPRIGLDEVQWAAKLPSLSPDALKFIAEHREWGQNATVCTALVRNPRMPLPLALRLLDRVPVGEVRAIAKGGAREQIVQAARKRVSG